MSRKEVAKAEDILMTYLIVVLIVFSLLGLYGLYESSKIRDFKYKMIREKAKYSNNIYMEDIRK